MVVAAVSTNPPRYATSTERMARKNLPRRSLPVHQNGTKIARAVDVIVTASETVIVRVAIAAETENVATAVIVTGTVVSTVIDSVSGFIGRNPCAGH